MSKINVLDLIVGKHNEGKEKIFMLKEITAKFSDEEVFSRIRDLVHFFYLHIPVHFKYEEILIETLRKHSDISPEINREIDEILEEHRPLQDGFNRLNELMLKIENGSRDNREEFIELAISLCIDLIEHAEKEDDCLFPAAKEKLSQGELKKIEEKISKIRIA